MDERISLKTLRKLTNQEMRLPVLLEEVLQVLLGSQQGFLRYIHANGGATQTDCRSKE